MLEVRGLTRTFGEKVAVGDVSFTVPDGQMTGFVGGNGAGKTTTMRMMMGVLRPTAGDVLFDDRPITDDDRRTIGYMPEERGLYPKQGLLGQLVYLAQLRGMDKAPATSRATELLERFDLADRANDKLETLSLGNQQRVQIAAAVISEPKALILDEPFSGLDPRAVDSMVDLLREFTAKGCPVLFSSHQLDLVERLCDRLVILARGEIVAQGSADELRRRGPQRHRLVTDADVSWVRQVDGVDVVEVADTTAVLELRDDDTADRVLREAMNRGRVREFAPVVVQLADVFREVA